MKGLVLVTALVGLASGNWWWAETVDDAEREPAEPCIPDQCLLPDCKCSTTDPPEGFPPADIPQIVFLTFNEGLTTTSQSFFTQIFNGQYLNPNGCPIRATHFVTHQYTDYSLVLNWWRKGHEIGVLSITETSNITYWQILNSTMWELEMAGMRTILSEFAKIPEEDIVGMRCPLLQNGGNQQGAMMYNNDTFLYDATMPSRTFGYLNMANGIWPYTFDYQSIQDCQIQPCITDSFPGVWEVPILDLEDNRDIWGNGNGEPCSYLGDCQGYSGPNPEEVFELLQRNFDRAYNGNRPPFGVHTSVSYFVGALEWQFEGYKMFLNYLTEFPDVYVVPVTDGLAYVENPVSLGQIDTFEPFKCDDYPRPGDCSSKQSCRYGEEDLPPELGGSGERYMTVCTTYCPLKYPWLGNPLGQSY